MDNCIFCRIVKGAVPASIVYNDETVMAFMDIRPVNPGHLLIIPKVHAAQLSALDEDTGGQIFKIAMRIAKALRRSNVRCDSERVTMVRIYFTLSNRGNSTLDAIHWRLPTITVQRRRVATKYPSYCVRIGLVAGL